MLLLPALLTAVLGLSACVPEVFPRGDPPMRLVEPNSTLLEPALGVHAVQDLLGVGEGAAGQDRHPRAGFDLSVHADALLATLGHQTEADPHGLLDASPRLHTEEGPNSVVALLGLHLQAGDQMHPEHLVAVARDLAANNDDPQTEDLMIARIQAHEETIWMLESYMV